MAQRWTRSTVHSSTKSEHAVTETVVNVFTISLQSAKLSYLSICTKTMPLKLPSFREISSQNKMLRRHSTSISSFYTRF